ncbi:MAG: hypothetical protein EA398_02870 [Deltaproteobacteria bacterium]|nr:MAG: hypothetical protein EA398_02870 [Deltaproteobacteria bacterium]
MSAFVLLIDSDNASIELGDDNLVEARPGRPAGAPGDGGQGGDGAPDGEDGLERSTISIPSGN